MRKKSNDVDMCNNVPHGQQRKMEEPSKSLSNPVSTTQYTYNYVTGKEINGKNEEPSVLKGVSKGFVDSNYWEINDTFPTFLAEATKVWVPKGVKRILERLPKRVLSSIDQDKILAVEKCLMTVSSLTSSLFMDDPDCWKALNSSILHEQLKRGNDNTFLYSTVLNALQYFTSSTEPIIESKKNSEGKDSYQTGVVSKQYRYTDAFRGKTLSSYEFKTKECIAQRRKYQYKLLAKASNNIIGFNLLNVYPLISLPTEREIILRAKQLIKESYHSKKGKLLTFLNHKKRDDFSNDVIRSFVEDNIKQFNYLTKNGFMTPIVGDLKSGGRVVDSFNLMPSWIRMMCKIDEEEIVELDFTALHPNIVMSLYGGKQKFLNHQMLADKLIMDVKEIKKEHLSFFNKHHNQMKESILYNYFLKNEPEMLSKLIKDKKEYGYKITARLMFAKEVEIMTECIKRLNQEGIYVIYVYDALYCKKSQAGTVIATMNETIQQLGVYTEVKSNLLDEINKITGVIYKAENTENGMVYIGSTTKTVEERKKDHIQKAQIGAGSFFHEAISSYGPDNFKWESIDVANSVNELAFKEKQYIASYDSFRNGYNNDHGGGFKKKIYQFTDSGLLVGEWDSLIDASTEVLGNEKGISNACLGYIKSYKGYYWSYNKNFTIPTDLRKKRVCQYDMNNVLINCFDSVSQASKVSGLSKTSISRVCRGERKYSGGFVWYYVD
ncbi:GIY-YIG nuclease family protein [Flagellimonas zhangzhouensis]|uniref:GIY-YIG catalytic domain-containing protein n=1 Tax=Flagellimonas zhangzhouensis TaxID=1073328 RepID=A0A1H2U9W4_9FLAO|nr:GIY-YIG nuclease family protein [Allomuricauda zhangzhouensis]SDQ18835.1 GIY-YIG catalytic domain-containing protein [Allomuricauda zhangzhouensis]SDW52951.1 GIY-YIG catalytic domain-containing protein [Allomuricauda zhangzhouensis]